MSGYESVDFTSELDLMGGLLRVASSTNPNLFPTEGERAARLSDGVEETLGALELLITMNGGIDGLPSTQSLLDTHAKELPLIIDAAQEAGLDAQYPLALQVLGGMVTPEDQ